MQPIQAAVPKKVNQGKTLERSFTGRREERIRGESKLVQNILVGVNGLTINLDHVMQMRSC